MDQRRTGENLCVLWIHPHLGRCLGAPPSISQPGHIVCIGSLALCHRPLLVNCLPDVRLHTYLPTKTTLTAVAGRCMSLQWQPSRWVDRPGTSPLLASSIWNWRLAIFWPRFAHQWGLWPCDSATVPCLGALRICLSWFRRWWRVCVHSRVHSCVRARVCARRTSCCAAKNTPRCSLAASHSLSAKWFCWRICPTSCTIATTLQYSMSFSGNGCDARVCCVGCASYACNIFCAPRHFIRSAIRAQLRNCGCVFLVPLGRLNYVLRRGLTSMCSAGFLRRS